MERKYILKFLFLSIFSVCISCNVEGKNEIYGDKTFTVQMKGMNYDSLFIYSFSKGPYYTLKIAGEKQDSNYWKFTIPDTVYEHLIDFEIIPQTFDYKTNTSHRIALNSMINGQRLRTEQLNFDDSLPSVSLRYENTTKEDGIYMSDRKGNRYLGTYKTDNFMVETPMKKTDLYLRMFDQLYGMFMTVEDTTYSYQYYIDLYIREARKYPDSRYYISRLAEKMNNYKTKQDIKQLYDCFSERSKKTIWGKKIQAYLDKPFENISLPNALTATEESLIQDSTRCTLVLFSASWCRPCHLQLPIQKKIYNDLKDRMDIVCITIDEPETIEAWRKYIRKEAIPWRSLLSINVEEVRQKYMVPSVPHAILVFPDKEYEALNLWEDADVKKIYNRINKPY